MAKRKGNNERKTPDELLCNRWSREMACGYGELINSCAKTTYLKALSLRCNGEEPVIYLHGKPLTLEQYRVQVVSEGLDDPRAVLNINGQKTKSNTD